MSRHNVALDESLLAKARLLATARKISIEELFAKLLAREEELDRRKLLVIGAMAEDAELLDEVVAAANASREKDSFRLKDDESSTP